MSEQDNINLVRDSVAAFSRGDAEGSAASYSERCEYFEAGTGRTFKGRAEFQAAVKGWLTAFPDAKGTVTNVFASGDGVAAEITYRGANTGPLATPAGTIPATGKVAEVPSALVCRVRDAKIQSGTLYFDMATLLRQLGVAG